MRISKEVEFDAGHRVPNHASKCRNPHGHRYRMRVTCEGPIITDPTDPAHGMLVDFGDLKVLMTELVHDPWDHAMIVHADDTDLLTAMSYDPTWKVAVVPLVPTAENLARLAFDTLAHAVFERFGSDLRVVEVAVWETPTSVAYYEGDQ